MTRDAAKITALEDLDALIRQEPAVLAWFSGPGCSVCGVLEPKVRALLEEELPRIRFVRVDAAEAPDVAAQKIVYAVPTAVIWFDGRETLRFTRAFGVGELRDALARPYALMFG